MTCPHCHYSPLPDNARYCPNCSQPVEIATRVEIRQDVEQNLGRVIGVQTDAIHGDVYGGDIYQVQVYVLSEAGRREGGLRTVTPDALPYKFLAPYGPRDRALFKGRQAQVQQVLRHIGAGRLFVLYGPTGVGKTSLLAAGVVPELVEAGALAVHIRDYSQPLAQTLRTALGSNREQLPIDLPAEASLSDLIRAVLAATQGTLVLVFDQFERLFHPAISPVERATRVNALVESLRTVEPELLRVILAVRDDALVRLSDLQEALPDLFRAFMELKRLDRDQARAAILEPLSQVAAQVYYEEGLAEELLIPDLDGLTPEDRGYIHPSHLQIVCHWLYQAAVGRQPPLIGQKLYLQEARGADGILARYLDETLRTRLADQQEVAQAVLVAMASPGTAEWVAPESLPLGDVPLHDARSVLERLVGAELLIQRTLDGRMLYALANQTLIGEIRRLAGPEIERRYGAQEELDRVWSAWLAHDDLASPRQLGRLADSAAHLSPDVSQRLFLLRSAVATRAPLAIWLTGLRTTEGEALVRDLEGLEVGGLGQVSRSQSAKARLLVGLEASGGPVTVQGERPPYGPLARAAVSDASPVTRQTAVLALTVPDRYVALDRLDWALRAATNGWQRLARKAELRGVLAEADPELEALNTSLRTVERVGVWVWRVGRRLLLDRHRIAALALGAAIGAGLGLGLLRFFTALLTARTPGLHAFNNFAFGALVGAAVILGQLVSPHLLLRSSQTSPVPDEPRSRQASWPQYALVLFLGALLFGLAHLFIVLVTGRLAFTGKGLVVASGFVAGLGISLGLFAWPIDRLWQSRARWPLRIALAAAAFALLQGAFIKLKETFLSVGIFWTSGGYRADLSRFGASPGWKQFMEAFSNWYHLVALLDAALVGMLLTFGIMFGLRLAGRFYARWLDLTTASGS